MELLTSTLVLFVALEHLGFLYLEMFLWTKKAGRKVFGHSKEDADITKALAANQGLYNGFITAGLVWGFFHPNQELGLQIILFFLSCIIVAGIFGAITAKKSILYIQALPAVLAATLLVL